MSIKNYDVLFKNQTLTDDEKQQVVSNIGAFDGDYAKLKNAPDLAKYALETEVATKVDKESGKSLMADADKTKLDTIATNADENVIETVSVAGSDLTPLEKKVTIPAFTADGATYGVVAKPTSATGKFLKDDGTWADAGKTYSGGSGISISADDEISVDTTVVATQTDLSSKVDVELGKGLSTNDFDDTYLNKLTNIEANADVNKIDTVKVAGTDLTIVSKSVDIPAFTADGATYGVVAKPTSSSGKFLKDDGTWADAGKTYSGGSGISISADDEISVDTTVVATQTDLSSKVDTVAGKGLSTNDYTTAEQTKLSGIADGAEVNTIDSITVNGTAATITEKVAAITVDTYSAGDGISIAATEGSDTDKTVAVNLQTDGGLTVNTDKAIALNVPDGGDLYAFKNTGGVITTETVQESGKYVGYWDPDDQTQADPMKITLVRAVTSVSAVGTSANTAWFVVKAIS